MNQKSVLVGLLCFVVVAFGGLIFYDMKVGHKFEKYLGKSGHTTNWQWEDQWDGKGPSNTPPQNNNPPPVNPNGPQLVAGSYAEALQKSGELGKPALVFFTADWCTWCKKMKAETLPDARVQALMKNYILVYVDTDKDRAPASKFGVGSLPAYVITNVKEDKLKADQGYKAADNFAAWLDNPTLYVQPKADAPKTQPQPPPEQKKTPPNNRRRPRNQPPQPNNPDMQPDRQVRPGSPGCPGG